MKKAALAVSTYDISPMNFFFFFLFFSSVLLLAFLYRVTLLVFIRLYVAFFHHQSAAC